jgi:ParB family chromosome partitioning protein
LRTIPLSASVVADGFNPRDEFDKAELERLTASVKEDGLLQPLLVAPPVDGEYRLVDGERRYRACIEAALVEVPVLVRATDEDTPGRDFALLANSLRVDLNPVEEAQAFKRLIDYGGLTRRGVAEKYKVTPKYVTERLRILEVPAELHPAIVDGSIPPSAVKAVGELAKVHPALPAIAAKRVADKPRHQWDEPTTWADFGEDPIGAVIGSYDDDAEDLPAGVFDCGTT